MKLISSIKTIYFLLALIFLGMLALNFVTPYLVDDFTYARSFVTGEKLNSLREIPASMHAHSLYLNGRYFAHFLVQCFEFLPKALFNALNAATFTLLVFLLYRLCAKEENALLLLAVFAMLWVFTPAFGQVFLWLDGSCNYGWGALWALLFVLPYIRFFRRGEKRSPVLWLALALFGFFMGGYLENSSAAAVYLALLFLTLGRLYKKHKLSLWSILPVISACGGFLFMVTRPAESVKSEGSGALTALGARFIAALNRYAELKWLLFAFVVLFTLACLTDTARERRVLSLALFSGSLGANFLLIFAPYFPERCLAFPTVLLAAAVGVLLPELKKSRFQPHICCAGSLLLLLTLYWGAYGAADIVSTGMQVRQNERTIIAEVAAGRGDVSLPMVESYTRYSPLYDLKYLDMADPASWPNLAMAQTFGANSIIGVAEEK